MARTEKKGSAEVREWEIGENSTRYDFLLAAPSDEALTRYWSAWVGISFFGGLFVASILVAFLSSKNVRSRSFNLYLIYLMIPDVGYATVCGLVCMVHAINKSQVAELCNFQMMFTVWGVGSNMWLNAAVTHQLYIMLQSSNSRRRYRIPTNKFVTKQSMGIYLLTIFLGTWGFIEAQQFPHYVASTSGLACIPVEQSWQSSIFFWLVFFPLFGAIPSTYIMYISFIVWKRGLLPPRGKRRLLVIYFGRIVIVFILCWVPFMLFIFAFTSWMPTWVHFAGGTLSHLQAPISAALSLLKPDLYHAVKYFYTCKWCRRKEQGGGGSENDDADEPSESTNSWIFNFHSMSRRRSGSAFWSASTTAISGIGQGERTPISTSRRARRSDIDIGQRRVSEGDDSVADAAVAVGDLESNAESGVADESTAPSPVDDGGADCELWPDPNGEYASADAATMCDPQLDVDVETLNDCNTVVHND